MTRLATARRVSWGFGDQALSSLTNFAIGVLVARTVSVEAFGAFSVAFTTYTVALITSRALASEPFMVRHSATEHRAWLDATRGSAGLALMVGVGAAVITGLLGLLLGGQLGIALVALAIVLPGLLAQDAWRFAFIAHGQPERAFAIDLAWLALIVPGLLALELELVGDGSLAWPILVWGIAGGITAIAAHVTARSRPTAAAGFGWLRNHRDLGGRYVTEALVSLGAIQISTYALVTFGGLAAAGALRGGQLLLGPILLVVMSFGITGVPEGVRMMERGGVRRLRRPALLVSLSVAGVTLMWGILVSNLPYSIGTAILGETWPSAKALILPLTLAYAAASLSLGPGVGLRVLADARRSLRARIIDASAQSIGGVVGAWQLGAMGTALGLAVASLLGAVAHWVLFISSMRHRPPGDSEITGAIAADSTDRTPEQDPASRRPVS